MAEEHDSWVAGIGIDVGRFIDSTVGAVEGALGAVKDGVLGIGQTKVSSAAPEGSNESDGEESEGADSGLAVKIPLGHRVLPKIKGPKIEILGGRFEIEGTFELAADGTIELSQGEEKKARAGSSKEIAIGVVPDGFLLEFGKKWTNEEGLKILNWNSVITEANMGLNATLGWEQSKLAYEAQAQLAGGTVKFEAVLISYDSKKGERKIATFGFAGSTPLKLGKVKVTKGIEVDLQFTVTFGAEAEPDWPVIFEKDVAPKLEAIGIESLTVAALFVAAVGVPIAAIKELVDIDDIDSAGKKWTELTDLLVEGHRLGFTGAAAPSDPRMLQTYNPAYAKFSEQVKALTQKIPGTDENAIKKKLSEAAAQEFEKQKGAIESDMEEKAYAAVWDAYGRAYKNRPSDLCIVWTHLHGGHLPKQSDLEAFKPYTDTMPRMLGR